jgi:plastocyanin
MDVHVRLLFTTVLLLVTAAHSGADTHVVGAYDITFVPEVILVNVGDTVRWEYISGSPHTVTTGENCTWDGDLHASLSIIDPVVEWVVPADAPSELPYFCAPHCINDMVGLIQVAQPCVADVTGDGIVGANDILLVLDQWGIVDSPADIDGDGIVDVNDLLLVVSNWGPCP